MSLRVGHSMAQVLAYVADHPECSKADAARAVAAGAGAGDDDGRLRGGYEAVNRCIRSGLIAAEEAPGHWVLRLTELGRAVITR